MISGSDPHKILAHVILSILLVTGILLILRIWRKFHKALQPKPRAKYHKKSETIDITNLNIDYVDFDERSKIYNHDPGYENPMFAVTEINQRFDTSLEGSTSNDKVDGGYPTWGYSSRKFQYSPINDEAGGNHEDGAEFHQFVNPIYKSPGN